MVPSKQRSLDKSVCPVIFYERVHHFECVHILIPFTHTLFVLFLQIYAYFDVVMRLRSSLPPRHERAKERKKESLSILHLRLDELIQRSARFPINQVVTGLFLGVHQLHRV